MAQATKLKKSIKATFNYTGRKALKAKECEIEITQKTPDGISVRIRFLNGLAKQYPDMPLILEAFHGALYSRQVLDPSRPEQTVFLDGFPEHARPQFRLRVVALDDPQARVLASSRPMRAKAQKDDESRDDAFFDPIPSPAIGDQLWKIDWKGDDDFDILVNSRLANTYDPNTNPMMRAWFCSSVIREVLMGLVLRNSEIEDLEHDSVGRKWIAFCDQRLPSNCPPYFREDDNRVSEEAIQWIEDVASEFCDTKWDGRHTLLTSLLGWRGI